jgi:hypothetical protein
MPALRLLISGFGVQVPDGAQPAAPFYGACTPVRVYSAACSLSLAPQRVFSSACRNHVGHLLELVWETHARSKSRLELMILAG